MKFIKFASLLVLIGLASCKAIAQPNKSYTTKDKKAIKRYEAALDAYQHRDMQGTITMLQELTQTSPDFVEPFFMLAQVYDETNQTEKAIEPLQAAMALNEKFYPAGWMMLAECYFMQGNYDEAEKAITKFMPYPKESVHQEKRSHLILSSCTYAKRAMASPVPFNPINLGEGVNTDRDEYYPCITADEQTLLFTRLVKDEKAHQGKQEDFFISAKKDKVWQQAEPVRDINTTKNEGAPTLSADGQTLIFTACESGDGTWGGDRQGYGSCDLFYSYKTPTGWTPAQNIGSGINTGTWESQPSFSANGRTLYFVRGKRTASGIKEQDIYYSYIMDNGGWSAPMKVPGKVNTMFEEESVMIHPDGQTMYFSSNGHSGMGGLDIFMSKMTPSGDWDLPVNLGYPINTYRNENSFQVTAAGDMALFASDREGGFGGLDLYQFDLHPKARPNPVTYVKGVVLDKLSYKKLDAHLQLIDLETGKTVIESYSNKGNGEFLLCIPAGKSYAMNVSKEGYLFHSENFSLVNYKSLEPYRLDIELQKLRPGATIVLNNVFFETNKWDLKPESMTELNTLADLLKANPTKKVEISGHTDNVGNDAANQTLSDNRAASVVTYLVGKGVAATQLTSKGYGESKPVATNDTEEGRAKNRRTEFKILE